MRKRNSNRGRKTAGTCCRAAILALLLFAAAEGGGTSEPVQGAEPEPARVSFLTEARMADDGNAYLRADNCGIRVLFEVPDFREDGGEPPLFEVRIDGREDTAKTAEETGAPGMLSVCYQAWEVAGLLPDGPHEVAVAAAERDCVPIENECRGVRPTAAGAEFILDTTAPVAVFSSESGSAARQGIMEPGSRHYYNADFSAAAEILDEWADAGDFSLLRGSCSSGEYDASAVEIRDCDAAIPFFEEGGAFFAADNVSEDGVYRYRVEGTDRAGNPVRCADGFFDGGWSSHIVRDTAAPSGFVTVLENGSEVYRMDSSGRVSFSEPYRAVRELSVEFRCPAEDEHSPVRIEGSAKFPDGAEVRTEDGAFRFGNAVCLPVGGPGVFRTEEFFMEDLAGNVTEGRPSDPIYMDCEPPEILLLTEDAEPALCADGTPLYRGEVPVRIIVADPDGSGGTGIGDVCLSVADGPSEAPCEEFVLHRGIRRAFEGNYTEDAMEMRLEDGITVSPNHYSDSVRVRLVVLDNAGNMDSGEITFGIDAYPPRIEVDFGGDRARNGLYFPAGRRASVRVTERHFSPELIETGPGNALLADWEKTGPEEWTGSLVCVEEGEYSIGVTGADLLGNPAYGAVCLGEAPDHFVVDRTPPEVKLSADSGESVWDGADSRCFLTRARILTIAAEDEHPSDEADLRVLLPDGTERQCVPGNGACEIVLGEEGSYDLHGAVADLAGNRTEIRARWTVDRSAPAVSFAGVEENEACVSVPAVDVLVADGYPDPDSVRAVITGDRTGRRTLPLTPEETEEGLRFRAAIPEEDDYYRLTCTASDLAGLEGRAETAFSVNRGGTEFEALYPPAGAVLREAVSPSVRIADVDPVTVIGFRVNGSDAPYTRDGDVLCYDGEIAEDGKYAVTVDTVDSAGHVCSMEPLEFLIDRTPPVLTCVTEGGGKESPDILVRLVSDDPDARFSLLELDGTSLTGEVTMRGGRAEVVIPAENRGRHVLRAVAVDPAGNMSPEKRVNVTVSAGADGRAPLLLLAAACAGLLIWRRRARQCGTPVKTSK